MESLIEQFLKLGFRITFSKNSGFRRIEVFGGMRGKVMYSHMMLKDENMETVLSEILTQINKDEQQRKVV